MDLPIDIKTKIEEISSSFNIKDLKVTSERLSSNYLSTHQNNESIVKTQLDVIAYCLTRMPATYSAVYSVLNQCKKYFKDSINSILDVGAGIGTASIACKTIFGEQIGITCIERESAMISIGKQLVNANWINKSLIEIDDTKADLVIASYCINELCEENKMRVIDNLYDNANKLLVIIEPGTPEYSKEVLNIRSHLIQKGAFIVGPCPHNGICPMKDNDWCHFATRVSRSKIHKLLKSADVPYEDEKYSYLIVSKIDYGRCQERILRHPIIKGNSVQITTCSNNGITNESIFKNNKEKYKLAKKSNCGDEL